jgi:hypothetical protein
VRFPRTPRRLARLLAHFKRSHGSLMSDIRPSVGRPLDGNLSAPRNASEGISFFSSDPPRNLPSDTGDNCALAHVNLTP